jgi:hypothetical protein
MGIVDYFRAFTYMAAAALLLTLTIMAMKVYPEIRAEIRDSHRVILSVGGTAAEIRASAKQWELASKQSQELTAQSTQILKNLATATATLNTTSTSLTAFIAHTDDNVNAILIPQLSSALAANNARLAQLEADTDQTVLALGATSKNAADAMTQATQTLAAAGKVLGDPAIPRIIANTETASQNVASTSAHVDAASADIQTKVHEMTRPASFVKRLAEAVLTLAAPMASLFK